MKSFKEPRKEIIDIMDHNPTPCLMKRPLFANDFILLYSNAFESILELSKDEERLAGVRINPNNYSNSRVDYWNAIDACRIVTDQSGNQKVEKRPVFINIPGLVSSKIDHVKWSFDGLFFSFTTSLDHSVSLNVVQWNDKGEISSNVVFLHEQIPLHLNSTLSDPYKWNPTGSSFPGITCLLRFSNENSSKFPPLPKEPPISRGLHIQEHSPGQKAKKLRTFQDLLKTPYDEDKFEHFTFCQLVFLRIESGPWKEKENGNGMIVQWRLIGEPGMITSFKVSPTNQHILVESIHRPFSFKVPRSRFPKKSEVLAYHSGDSVYRISDLPLAEDIPIEHNSCRKGPRVIHWRQDSLLKDQIVWIEALDEGNPTNMVEHRDAICCLPIPCPQDQSPSVIFWTTHRFSCLYYGNGFVCAEETWWNLRTEKMTLIYLTDQFPKLSSKLLWERSSEDRYTDPGDFVERRTPKGTWVLLQFADEKGIVLFLRGSGASPQGDHPFLDLFSVNGLSSTRVFVSKDPHFERVIAPLLPVEVQKGEMQITNQLDLLTKRESILEQPNYWKVGVQLHKEGPECEIQYRKQLTFHPHPFPHFQSGIQKQVVHYLRSDGVQLSSKLLLPPGYSVNLGPIPLVFWAYPREFKDASVAGQVQGSPNRFPPWNSLGPFFFLLEGYAVLDGPSLPIIDPTSNNQANDTYVEQLVAGAEAACNHVIELGVTAKGMIAVGGHSYGAAMTSHLLAHTEDLFSCGIARSGCYNRTLTPFGFQNEHRTLWEAPKVYTQLSTIMVADKIKKPLLLIHGELDSNPGTFPLQSQRLFSALEGNGVPARLVLLPYESHSYRARENVMHTMWEMLTWLKKHIRQTPLE